MATTGVNNTAKWELVDGVLTLSPVDGVSGSMVVQGISPSLFPQSSTIKGYINELTEEELNSIQKIKILQDVSFYVNFITVKKQKSITRTFFTSAVTGVSPSIVPNLHSIDISGLNCTGVETLSLENMELTELIGLDQIDYTTIRKLGFAWNNLVSLDLSKVPLHDDHIDISSSFYNCPYLRTITFPENCRRTRGNSNPNAAIQHLGLTFITKDTEPFPVTKGDITILSDNDFFGLSSQGGTWIRELDQNIPLYFRVKSTDRDGQTINIAYDYRTNADTQVSVFYKGAEDVNYPTNPQRTFNITGVENNAVLSFTVDSDRAYDVMLIASDGTTNVYSFARVESNNLLFTLNESIHALSAYTDNQKILGVTKDGDIHFAISDDIGDSDSIDYRLRSALIARGWYDKIEV